MSRRQPLKIWAVTFVLSLSLTFGFEILQTAAGATSYPPPFGMPELHFTNIAPFYKWTGVLARMDAQTKPPQLWLDNSRSMKGAALPEMAQKVNTLTNRYDYIADLVNWGKTDYWATPAEFFSKGGDCEDFAIAKYAWLLYLGVPEERLRIAIVHDRIRNIPHAVLILYINDKAMVLDSQVKDIRDSLSSSRYRMIYSLHRFGWWYPLTSEDARVSSKDMPVSIDCPAGATQDECLNAVAPAAE
jgi:predicted transglutaminase-like cysteine proteinase